MDFKTAQKIAVRPSAHSLMELSAAFTWADRKAGDRRVSVEYRNKCHEIAKAIWKAADQGVLPVD